MASFIDARIPVVFGAVPGQGDVVFQPEPSVVHPAGCACCVSRSRAAVALDKLFLQRVRGEVPWFQRVVVPADDPALRASLADDPLLSARFRLG